MNPNSTPPDWDQRRIDIRQREYEFARELADATLMRLNRVLARPWDQKVRLNDLARLVALASRLGRLSTGLPQCKDPRPNKR